MKKNRKDESSKPIYEAPRVSRLDDSCSAFGDTCADGSGADGFCENGPDPKPDDNGQNDIND